MLQNYWKSPIRTKLYCKAQMRDLTSAFQNTLMNSFSIMKGFSSLFLLLAATSSSICANVTWFSLVSDCLQTYFTKLYQGYLARAYDAICGCGVEHLVNLIFHCDS